MQPVDSFADLMPLIIVGASARAAAHSALRGGLAPVCVDLFGDVDLRSVARVVTVADLAAQAVRAVAELPAAPWMYTGAVENHPRLIARLGRTRDESAPRSKMERRATGGRGAPRLLGHGPEILARVRDPWWLDATLRAAGLPALDVWPRGADPPPTDGRWLCKPVRGGGGRGIRICDGPGFAARAGCYFQRYAAGDPWSAQFLARPEQTLLLGVTRQLIGRRDLGAPPFAWCGGLAPASHAPSIVEMMRRAGECLAAAGGLRGLFGCDFVVAGGVPWLTEVNPRYTAAMELLDYRLQTSLVAWHARACGAADELGATANFSSLESQISNLKSAIPCAAPRAAGVPIARQTLGKVVLFAESDVVLGDATRLLRDPRDARLPHVADLPAPGSRIRAGNPVCTLFATEGSEEACLAALLAAARAFQREYLRSCG